MKAWVQAILGVFLTGVLIQYALYVHHRQTYTQLVLPEPQPARHGTPENAEAEKHGLSPPPALPVNASIPYPFIINKPNACGPRTELIVVVITAPNNTDDRMAVRETWGSYATDPEHNTSLVFLLGATPSAQLQAKLQQENEKYKDIVQADFVDSYRNLTVKSVTLLRWVSLYCNSSKYTLKADDDMYVNVPNLIKALKVVKMDLFVMGHTFIGAVPVKDKKSKWYTPQEAFNEKVYPKYTSGTTYSMSTKAAVKLYETAKTIPLFWLEDIYITGLCARKAGIPAIHNRGFNYYRIAEDGCFFRRAITGHRYTAQDKRRIHKEVYDPNHKCNR